MFDLYLEVGFIISAFTCSCLVFLMYKELPQNKKSFGVFFIPVLVTGAMSFLLWPFVLYQLMKTGGMALEDLAAQMTKTMLKQE